VSAQARSATNTSVVSSPSGPLVVNITTGGGALPDLVVTALTAGNAGNPGGSVNMSTTVQNQGSANSGEFQLEFYFSPTSTPSLDTAIDADWGCSMADLASGASEGCGGPVGIPPSLPPGTWYLAVAASSGSQVVNWRIADTGPVTVGAPLTVLGAGSDGNLYSVIPATGATTLIGPFPALMSGIAAYNGSLYGLSSPPNSFLYGIDPNSGAGLVIGSGTGASLNALAFNSSGALYAVGGDSLYTIDTGTGLAALVGSGSGSGSYQSSGGLAFDFFENLYLTSVGLSGDQLFSLDPAAGQGTLIGDIGVSSVHGLAYYDGTLYGFSTFTGGGEVMEIDSVTGAGGEIAGYSPSFNGTTVFAPGSSVNYTISGQVTLSGSGLGGVTVTLSGSQGASATTSGSGNYSFTVPAGGNYTVAPSLSGYSFNPPSSSFNNLSANQTANFTATPIPYTISGQVTLSGSGLSGVTVTLSGSQSNSATTNGSGNYSFTVPAGGNYMVMPSLAGYTFSPPNQSFYNLSGNQTASFAAQQVIINYTISGQVTLSGTGLPGVTMTLSGSQSGTTTTDGSGNYSFAEAARGSYTVTPSLSGYTFSPPSLSFNNLSGNQSNASFAASTVSSGLNFVSMAPCRVVDTRDASKPPGFGTPFISGQTSRSFTIPNGPCGIPAAAQAYSLNVTVAPHSELGYLTVWPTGQSQPLVSTLNSLDGEVKANAAIVPAGTGGAISVFATNDTDVILDINGYFVPPGYSGSAFYPMTPCRLVDTRPGAPSTILSGELIGGTYSILPIRSSRCNVPATAQAYSLNFTLVPPGPVGYLTVYPTGENLPIVSTLNDPTGTVEANAAIAPAGSGGDINVYVTNTTHLVVDINGYFAPAGEGGLSLYTLPTCRVLDTRNPPGAPPFIGTISVNVLGGGCGGNSTAQAYVFNATVVPEGPLGYLTLWPQGSVQPVVSTLNAYNGGVTSNMAIVPTSNTEISAFANNSTYLILDISGYFAP
jgi:hypothetical protein